MSGPYDRWVESNKVTEKHLAGPFDGLPDTVVSGLVISDASGGGTAKIDVSTGIAHIAGFEQRPDAVSAQALTDTRLNHVYLAWDEGISIVPYIAASEPNPPVGLPSPDTNWLLLGIVETGTGVVNWIWNNPLVRGGHIDDRSVRVGQGVPDKGMLFGIPHVRRVTYANVPGTTEVEVLSWPSAGSARGRPSFISWWTEGAAVTNRLRIVFDAESASATTWFFEEPTNDPFTVGSFPYVEPDLLRSSYYDHVGQATRKSFDADGGGALPHFHFWTRGQFETGFKVRAYNGDASPRDMNIIVFWEEFPEDNIGGY